MTIRATRYFRIQNKYVSSIGPEAQLVPDNGDTLPLDALQAVVVYQNETHSLVKALITHYQLEDMADFAETDPLTWDGVSALDIVNSYMGETIEQALKLWQLRTGETLNTNNIIDVEWM